jgi:tetratricopeptide (TPR) repeat protein
MVANGKIRSVAYMSEEELLHTVEAYPWFALARKELCIRMSRKDPAVWGADRYGAEALYLPDRKAVFDIYRSRVAEYEEPVVEDVPVREEASQGAARKVKSSEMPSAKEVSFVPDESLYTETLAAIYAEQGYYEQAKRIYSKLLLVYPEKNAYFAALIEKLNQKV